MSDHIPDAGKMVSDTPRTDRNYIGMQIVPAGFAMQLERELNAANSIIRQQQLLDEENLGLRQRIKRLEEAGDRITQAHCPFLFIEWTAAKESKP